MTVKELITELQKQPPDMVVMIQQGEEFDYMTVYTVKEKELIIEDKVKKTVVIEYS